MSSYLRYEHYDLVTPDGYIHEIKNATENGIDVSMRIEKISGHFVGYEIDPASVVFNFKSLLAQLGLNGIGTDIQLDKKSGMAELNVSIVPIGPIAREMLKYLQPGAYIGKLFAADERRQVRNPDYLARMFGRSDRKGRPLLSLGGMQGSDQFILERVQGHMVAYLTLREGKVDYAESIYGFLQTIGYALCEKVPLRELLRFHQRWVANEPRVVEKDKILLVKSLPLHIRTVFARVADNLLAPGYHHTSANVLQPDTQDSGDIYELFGQSDREIYDIPLEFYTLEPYKEHVFFSDRDQLQSCLDNSQSLFEAFQTAPKPEEHRAAVFIVKGTQLLNLKSEDWIEREPRLQPFPGISQGTRQSLMVERYLEQQPCFSFLKAIEDGLITSQGILLSRYFPSPMMKRMLLSNNVQRCLKALYFQIPSRSNSYYFSQEDRALLIDLATFGIQVFWVDETSNQILQYIQRPNKSSGMFVPLKKINTFLNATFFGIYGSNLLEGNFEIELKKLLAGILGMREEMQHPLLNKDTPLALVTGGGPGAMEVGNRMARELDILSCANIVDFTVRNEVVNEQKQNPFVEAKMTYRLDHLVERQAEFYLDFPIFVVGGIGTDFEFSLEEVRRKIGSRTSGPMILFGSADFWHKKITSRFQCNLEAGTIKGSEWISNSFFCIHTAQQGLKVYRDYFSGKLPVGKNGPFYPEGFVLVDE